MSINLAAKIWELPSSRRFIQQVGADLKTGRSLWVLLPGHIQNAGFQEVLCRLLEFDLGLEVRFVDIGGSLRRTAPMNVLMQSLTLSTPVAYLEDLLDQPNLPDVLLLTHFAHCEPALQAEWVRLVERWANASRNRDRRTCLCLLVPAPALRQPNRICTDVTLGVHYWFGIPSNLEVRALCQLACGVTNVETQWREALVASLAANDLDLCEALWDVVSEPAAQIVAALRAFARRQRWEQVALPVYTQQVRALPAHHKLVLNHVTEDVQRFIDGWVVYTPEYGEEVHSALLANHGKTEEINHRLWRAQNALLMPVLDDLRIRVCRELHRRYGKRWLSWNEQEGEAYIELGALEWVLRTCPELAAEKRRYYSQVRLAWQLRNRLAHYQTLFYDEYLELWQASQNLGL